MHPWSLNRCQQYLHRIPQVHAALAAILYAERPLERQRAELQWELASEFDTRYEDMGWVAREKHWGPNLLLALEKFLTLQ